MCQNQNRDYDALLRNSEEGENTNFKMYDKGREECKENCKPEGQNLQNSLMGPSGWQEKETSQRQMIKKLVSEEKACTCTTQTHMVPLFTDQWNQQNLFTAIPRNEHNIQHMSIGYIKVEASMGRFINCFTGRHQFQ